MRTAPGRDWQPLPQGRQTPVGHWEWTPGSHEVVLDAAAAGLLGALPQETPAQTWQRAVLPQDRARTVRALRAGVETSYRVRTPDGGVRTLLSRTTHTARDPERRAGVVLDVSGLDDASAHASALLHTSPDGFASVGADLRVTLVNSRACEEAGRRAHELLGLPLDALFRDDGGVLSDLAVRVLTSGRPDDLSPLTSPAGRPCQVHAVPSATGVALWWRDLDDRARAAAEHEQALVAERRARRAAEEAGAALSVQASSDALTGLANRTELARRLGGHLARDGHAATVLFLDLDHFKDVNDTLGHSAGDELLTAVAERLRLLVRASDVVARIGGDEFVVALLDDDTASAASAAEDVAHRVLAAVREPLALRGRSLVVTASIGVAVGTNRADVDALLHDADVALYRSKHGGRDGITWFDAELRRQVVERLQLESDLRAAPGSGQLALDYQACYDLTTNRVIGVEALLRWNHPDRGPVDPSQAVRLAEQTGLIVPVGAWVLGAAVADSARWQHREPFTTWVNVSARQLVREGFADALLVRLAEAGVPPWRFGVEVTESALAAGGPAEEEVARLSASGIRVAIDDFGTGYSSLARLARFPVDVLKIDRALVQGVRSRRGAAVVRGIVTLGHAIEARVVAEGVERPEELDRLREAGCDAALGYLLSRPGPAGRVPTRAAGDDPLP